MAKKTKKTTFRNQRIERMNPPEGEDLWIGLTRETKRSSWLKVFLKVHCCYAPDIFKLVQIGAVG